MKLFNENIESNRARIQSLIEDNRIIGKILIENILINMNIRAIRWDGQTYIKCRKACLIKTFNLMN